MRFITIVRRFSTSSFLLKRSKITGNPNVPSNIVLKVVRGRGVANRGCLMINAGFNKYFINCVEGLERINMENG